MIIEKFDIEKHSDLARAFRVNDEKCNNPEHYNDYLLYNAYVDFNKGLAVTYVIIDEDNRLAGYFSLKTSSLIFDNGDNSLIGDPAIELSELAISKNHCGQGLGTAIVSYIIQEIIMKIKEMIGIKYFLVCADPTAVDFYKNEKLNFVDISNQSKDIPRESWNSNCVPLAKMLKTSE